MSESSIPAWKRAGLKQVKRTLKQSEAAYDPLKEGLKRVNESGDGNKTAKPAKRVKLPKAERPVPMHELDQLAYLRQFSEDRDNWKFSKQKQNWILKNMYNTDAISDKYDEPLLKYIESLMGSARGWAIDDANEVIKFWNQFMREDLEKKNEENEETNDPSNADDESLEDKALSRKNSEDTIVKAASEGGEVESSEVAAGKQKKKNKAKKSKEEPVKKVPSEKLVRRAQNVVKLLTGEAPVLEFLDTVSS